MEKFKWYEIGKMNWEEKTRYVEVECLKKGLVYPECIIQEPIEPTDPYENDGYYMHEVVDLYFKNHDEFINFNNYLLKLIDDGIIFDRDGKPMRPDSYTLRTEKKFVPAKKSSEYKNTEEYKKYKSEKYAYDQYLETIENQQTKYHEFSAELTKEYEEFKLTYNDFLIVKNAFLKTLGIVEDVAKTEELMRQQFSDLDTMEKDDFFEIIKSELESQN